jgi:hypothetical protein
MRSIMKREKRKMTKKRVKKMTMTSNMEILHTEIYSFNRCTKMDSPE